MGMGRVLFVCLAMLLTEVSLGEVPTLPPGFKLVPPVNTIQITPANGAMRATAFVPIQGEIDSDKYLTVANALRDFQGVVVVRIESLGGDVRAAISLGRLFRNYRASITVPVDGICASACVLIYAGGSVRFLAPGAKLIVHRPYLTGIATADNAETRSRYVELRSSVTRYLSDMNVASGLFDLMQGIPPADQRILSDVEAKSFGLIQVDPVEEELRVDEFASRAGISKEEYRRRVDLVRRLCGESDLSKEWYACSAEANRVNSP